MASPSLLTISFLDKRPSSAAQALVELDAVDAAEFLDSVPTRYVVRTLSHMNAWSASGLIEKMKVANAAAVLRELDYPAAAAILRLMDETVRTEILALIPEQLRRDFETSLSFPDDTVGAQMTTSILSLTSGHTVANAIALLRKSDPSDPDTVFIVDEARGLTGAVTPARLLKSAASKALEDVADRDIVSLSARARLGSVAGLAAWERYPELPVLSRNKQLIGALSRETIRDHDRPPAHAGSASSGSIFGAIASTFYASAVGLGRLLADLEKPETNDRQQDTRS